MLPEELELLQCIRAKYASTTYATKKYLLQQYLKYLERNQKHIFGVNKDDVQKYLLSLRKCNQQSKRRVWKLLCDFYDYLEVPVNPVSTLEVHVPYSERLYNIPSMDETAVMVAAMHSGCTASFSLRNLLLGELAYGSGLRLCEMHRLDIGDVDVKAGTVTVQGKGSKIRTVPVTAVALRVLGEYLNERKASHGPLFVTETGRRLGSVAIGVLFRKYTGRSPHLFRHACASHLLQNECDIRYIQELLGHRYLTTTQIYTHFDKKKLYDIVNSKHPRSGFKGKKL